ncbi:chromosomal replication initiator protein DnaA [Bacillota bacterium Meth-B3]
MIHQDRWAEVLRRLENNKSITYPAFNTWIRTLIVMMAEDGKMVLGTKDMTGMNVLRQRYSSMISGAVREVFGQEYEVFIVNANDPAPLNLSALGAEGMDRTDLLNPKYTFDTFVVGESNRFAHAASLAVAEIPNDAYNPLFLYGGVGLGKTHLMHAIGHHMRAENPSVKLLYITSERFTNDVIEAIQNKTTTELRDRLRNVDVLMVDDIQFIAGKTSTQEEFFHTFNHLHTGGKQIVISSDRPPKDIPTLEERLRSRFEWGLIADIQKPDYETRVAILRKKAATEHYDIPDEVLSFIAEKVESNIRELEGSLTRVNAEATVKRQSVTLELAQQSLSNLVGVRDAKRITPDLIMQVVADYYRLDRAELTSAKRHREIALPRQVAMYLCREMTSLSTTRIGDAFGGRDHTTVMHGCNKIANESRVAPQLSKALDDLRSAIRDK